MSPAGLRSVQRRNLNLPGKAIGSREVSLAVNERAPGALLRMQNFRSFAGIQPAGHQQGIVVCPDRPQFRTST